MVNIHKFSYTNCLLALPLATASLILNSQPVTKKERREENAVVSFFSSNVHMCGLALAAKSKS